MIGRVPQKSTYEVVCFDEQELAWHSLSREWVFDIDDLIGWWPLPDFGALGYQPPRNEKNAPPGAWPDGANLTGFKFQAPLGPPSTA
jgi:hypothetical protein